VTSRWEYFLWTKTVLNHVDIALQPRSPCEQFRRFIEGLRAPLTSSKHLPSPSPSPSLSPATFQSDSTLFSPSTRGERNVMSKLRPRFRQTCDSCRKAKVKCDKRSPICGRCLVTGVSCDYGVSNQGGRWKNGEKIGAQNNFMHVGSAMPSNSLFDHCFLDANAMAQYSMGDSALLYWQQTRDSSIWQDSLGAFQNQEKQLISPSATPNPQPRASASLSSTNLLETTTDQTHLSDQAFDTMPDSNEKQMGCMCLLTILQRLQFLHQTYPCQISPSTLDVRILSYATVLELNEEAMNCCTSTLRCAICRTGQDSEPFILLATLLRKVFLITESWISIPPSVNGSHLSQDGTPSSSNRGFPQEEKQMKTEVSLVTMRKMDAALAQLKQAAQILQSDYERLSCASLTASLGERLSYARRDLGDIQNDAGSR
jgi:hypothetical protein